MYSCDISVCEYYTINNNCKKCEHDCKHFDGFCRLLEELKPCYLVNNCYYKQLKDASEQYRIAVNALKKIGVEQYYLPQTVAKETLNQLGELISEKKEV